MALRVTHEVLRAIAVHAREAAPDECCGILLAETQRPGTVTGLVRAGNAEVEQPARRYLIDHRAQLAALDVEIEGKVELAGYYHSHPAGAPVPSPTDVAEALPETVYLICGLATGEPEFAAWRVEAGQLMPEAVEVAGG